METWVYQHISDFLWRLSAHFTLALRAAARLARPLDRPYVLSWIWWLWGYKWWIQVSSCLLFLAVTVGSYWRWEAKTEYCLFFFFSAWIKPFFFGFRMAVDSLAAQDLFCLPVFLLRTLFWNFEVFALSAGVLTSVTSILNFLTIENICNSFIISSRLTHTWNLSRKSYVSCVCYTMNVRTNCTWRGILELRRT